MFHMLALFVVVFYCNAFCQRDVSGGSWEIIGTYCMLIFFVLAPVATWLLLLVLLLLVVLLSCLVLAISSKTITP